MVVTRVYKARKRGTTNKTAIREEQTRDQQQQEEEEPKEQKHDNLLTSKLTEVDMQELGVTDSQSSLSNGHMSVRADGESLPHEQLMPDDHVLVGHHDANSNVASIQVPSKAEKTVTASVDQEQNHQETQGIEENGEARPRDLKRKHSEVSDDEDESEEAVARESEVGSDVEGKIVEDLVPGDVDDADDGDKVEQQEEEEGEEEEDDDEEGEEEVEEEVDDDAFEEQDESQVPEEQLFTPPSPTCTAITTTTTTTATVAESTTIPTTTAIVKASNAPLKTPSPIKSRRPSRSCKPNSLIFNSDTTIFSPKRRRKKAAITSPSQSSDLITTSTPIARVTKKAYTITNSNNNKKTAAPVLHVDLNHRDEGIRCNMVNSSDDICENKNKKRGSSRVDPESRDAVEPVISSRSFARESVRKAVSALTGVNRPAKKLGRPRKYPLPEDPLVDVLVPNDETDERPIVTNGRTKVRRKVKGRRVIVKKGKKLSPKTKRTSPTSGNKCTPILTAILSGQTLAQTKTGRPKGRPRVLPSLDEVILNGAKSQAVSTTPSTTRRSSLRRCDCESKYKKILSQLEQSLEVKFAESTQKLRKDMEQTDAENSRLQTRISSLQRELDYLKNRLDHAKDAISSHEEIEELKVKHQYELSRAKRTQWCSNCEREAIYFCCWNSSYCSLECQQHHWHAVHKKVCRNKDVKR